jgi:histidine triad (HIT) family protein
MASPDDCLFCKIAAGEIPATILHQDEHLVSFRDIRPEAPTHVLVIPRKHLASVSSLSAEDTELAGRLLLEAARLAGEQNIAATGYRLVSNSGEWAGQTVDHLHLHVLGGRRFGWPPG